MAGMWYHVMNRGNRREAIFHDDDDRVFFLERLYTYCDHFNVELDSYVLMDNHYHMQLRTREANLSRFMHDVQTTYVGMHNSKYEKSGHLFQGRYRAVAVERQGYGIAVNRYIHLNPVRTGMCSGKTLRNKRRELRGYKWSSYRTYLGLERPPDAMIINNTLSQFGRTRSEQRAEYARFVEEGLLGEIENPFDDVVEQSVLGKASFMERVRHVLIETGEVRDTESSASQQRLLSRPIDEILQIVSQSYGVAVNELVSRECWFREARQMAMWLACKRSIGRMDLGAIGRCMGGVSRSAVAKARGRMDARIRRNAAVRKRVRRLMRESIIHT